MTLRQCLVFRVSDALLAMEVAQVVEVLGKRTHSRVPDMPDFVAGVMELRGQIVPVVDLRSRLSVEPLTKKPRHIVVRLAGERVALLVDEVRGIFKVPEAEIKAPPPVIRGLKREYLTGLFQNEALGVIMMLNTDNILNSQERIELQAALHQREGAGA